MRNNENQRVWTRDSIGWGMDMVYYPIVTLLWGVMHTNGSGCVSHNRVNPIFKNQYSQCCTYTHTHCTHQLSDSHRYKIPPEQNRVKARSWILKKILRPEKLKAERKIRARSCLGAMLALICTLLESSRKYLSTEQNSEFWTLVNINSKHVEHVTCVKKLSRFSWSCTQNT